jgi:hypothetical protein
MAGDTTPIETVNTTCPTTKENKTASIFTIIYGV